MTEADDITFDRERCPRCQMGMIRLGVSPAAEGFENHKVECLRCGHTQIDNLPPGRGANLPGRLH
jgi:ribosomal protein S27AE